MIEIKSHLTGKVIYKHDGDSLTGASLYGANLREAILPTGETWEEYKGQVIPALLKAGSHIVNKEAWKCHQWTNCPMAQAFGVNDIENIPLLYKPRAEQFIQFFDAGLLDDLADVVCEKC